MTTTPQGKPPARPATLAPEYTTGAELQTLREAAGLSRDALADLVGVQARTVKHWENGRAGVPADVAAVAQHWAQWVRKASTRLHAQAMHTPAQNVVFMRYRETAHMPAWCCTADNRHAEAHGAAVAQAVQRLALDGVAARVVWFDPAAYGAWIDAQRLADTPDMRAHWAAGQALPSQAVPARGDQPPAAPHTPARQS